MSVQDGRIKNPVSSWRKSSPQLRRAIQPVLDCDVGDKWNFIMLTTEIGGCLLKQLAFITLTNTLPKLLMKAIAGPHGTHQNDLKIPLCHWSTSVLLSWVWTIIWTNPSIPPAGSHLPPCLCHLRTPCRYTQRLWGVGHDMTARR